MDPEPTHEPVARAARAGAHRYPVLRLFGGLSPAATSVLLFSVALIPPGVGLVGAAVAYELTANPWIAGAGLLLGGLAGLLFVRDFLRWRVRPVTLVAMAGMGALFAVAYR